MLAYMFSFKDLRHLSYFLGVEVITTLAGLFLSQQKYICEFLTKLNLVRAKPTQSLMCLNLVQKLLDSTSLVEYRSIVGGLQYLAFTHPDFAFTVNKLSQFMHQPTTSHWSFVKQLLRYLNRSLDHGLLLCRKSSLTLRAFSVADWAGNHDDRTSTSAHVIFLSHNAISWSSNKQKYVAQSSTEAEYRAAVSATAEVIWLKSLLAELGVFVPSPLPIYCDNVKATYLCANPVFHSRMKHIAIIFHFV